MTELGTIKTSNPPDLPEGYKMTELGPLPEEWRVVRLGDLREDEVIWVKNGFPQGKNEERRGVPYSEQHEIARILQAVDEKICAEEGRRAALEALFKTLLHHLMTGKVRVKGLALQFKEEVTPTRGGEGDRLPGGSEARP